MADDTIPTPSTAPAADASPTAAMPDVAALPTTVSESGSTVVADPQGDPVIGTATGAPIDVHADSGAPVVAQGDQTVIADPKTGAPAIAANGQPVVVTDAPVATTAVATPTPGTSVNVVADPTAGSAPLADSTGAPIPVADASATKPADAPADASAAPAPAPAAPDAAAPAAPDAAAPAAAPAAPDAAAPAAAPADASAAPAAPADPAAATPAAPSTDAAPTPAAGTAAVDVPPAAPAPSAPGAPAALPTPAPTPADGDTSTPANLTPATGVPIDQHPSPSDGVMADPTTGLPHVDPAAPTPAPDASAPAPAAAPLPDAAPTAQNLDDVFTALTAEGAELAKNFNDAVDHSGTALILELKAAANYAQSLIGKLEAAAEEKVHDAAKNKVLKALMDALNGVTAAAAPIIGPDGQPQPPLSLQEQVNATVDGIHDDITSVFEGLLK